jgi:DNA mismatch repair protein MutS2
MVEDARARRETKELQAEELLKTLEEREARVLEDEARARGRALEAEAAAARAEALEREIGARKKSEVDSFARELRRRGEEAARKAADAIREAVQKVEASASASAKATAAAASKARSRAVAEIRESHEEVLRDQAAAPAPLPEQSGPPALGSRVRVATLGVVGEVVELHGERELEVAVGGKRLRVPLGAVDVVEGAAAAPRARVVAPQKSGSVPAEINLVGLTVDEAVPRVDKLLDDAALSERREIRVIHGFGQGKLRKAIAELLAGHPHVSSFRPGGPREGGAGATVVELKE